MSVSAKAAPAKAVRLSAAAFDALALWPAILDRSRHGPFPFLPIAFGAETARVRELLAEAQAQAWGDGSVPLTPALVAALAPEDGPSWADYVERAKWSGQAALSLNEQLALAEWLPAIRDALTAAKEAQRDR